MLMLYRKQGQSILLRFGKSEVGIKVHEIRGRTVRIALDFSKVPKDEPYVEAIRSELCPKRRMSETTEPTSAKPKSLD